MSVLIDIKDLSVSSNKQIILENLNLQLFENEKHLLMGPNGSGKTTLANILMGHPDYKIVKGSIFFRGKDITKLSTNDRACMGIFVAFQHPPDIFNIQIFSFLKSIYEKINQKIISVAEFKKLLENKLKISGLDTSIISRNRLYNLSGGEKKKFELLQYLLLNPQLAIFDEIDSGLDIDSLKQISNLLKKETKTFLIISHNINIASWIYPNKVSIIQNGKIVQSGGIELIKQIEKHGYNKL